MELIIDRNFLDNFFLLYDEKNLYHKDIRSFFKKVVNCRIITNYTSLEEFIQEAENSNPLLLLFIETQVPEIIFQEKLYAEKEVLSTTVGSTIKLFFLEKETRLSEKGYISINTKNIDEAWKPIYQGRNEEQNKLKTTKDKFLNRFERFEKWEDIKNFNHPFHSLVIVDRYILTNKPNQRIENNFFLFMKNLFAGNQEISDIDILIITHAIDGVIQENYNKISSFFKKRLGLKNFHFSLVVDPPGVKFEHFRRIYTNYFSITAENSFNIFKDNGSYLDKNNNITFNFLFGSRNFRFAKKEIEDIKKWLSKINNRTKIGSDSEKIYFIPDKRNRLLEMEL